MKEFFNEWWQIQKEEKAMEKAYMKKHWKGVTALNAAFVVIPIIGAAINSKIQDKKLTEQLSKIEDSK